MIDMRANVAVIGGGPSGLIFSRKLAKEGIDVTLLEEHSRVGFPNHCAGLVSINCMRKLVGLSLKGEYVLNKVRGAKIYSPSGKIELVIERSIPQAVVLDRELMDRTLYEVALAEGVKILLNTKANEIFLRKNIHIIKLNNVILKCQVLVNAEGAKFKFARSFSAIPPAMFREVLPAVQVEVKGISDLDVDYVEVYLGRVWAPNFFVWIIPIDEERARIGLASSERAPLKLLRKFLRCHPRVKSRLVRAKEEKIFGGLVYIGGPLRKTFSTRALLIGDAGGFTKPTTGGGIFTGAISSNIAARVVKLAYDSSDFSNRVFSLYERLWKKALKRELMLMKYFRKIFWGLSDLTLENLMGLIEELNMSSFLEDYSDLDYQLSGISIKNVIQGLFTIARDILT